MSPSAEVSLTRLGQIVGADHLITEAERLAHFEVDGLRPAAAVQPGSAQEMAEVICFASTEKLAVIPVGAGTKLWLGAPPRRYDLAIEVARLNRVLAYDPGDLTVSVEAGMRLADLQRLLKEKRQFLPLAVPFAREATLGGVLATNSSGPLRQLYGTARDFVLGMEFVTGEGARAKSGGRVVKNVAGYDLHKLMIGALGTLGVITSVNFKTFPLPPVTGAFIAGFRAANGAWQFRHTVAASPLQPHLVEIVSPKAAALLHAVGNAPPVLPVDGWSAVVAAGGNERVVERHRKEFERLARDAGSNSFVSFRELGHAEKEGLLDAIQEFPAAVMKRSPLAALFRISSLASHLIGVGESARRAAEENSLEWAGLMRGIGVAYVALFPAATGGDATRQLAAACKAIFENCAAGGQHAVIEFASADLKHEVDVWGPPRDDLRLWQRVKTAFDPQGILSPGRFSGGI